MAIVASNDHYRLCDLLVVRGHYLRTAVRPFLPSVTHPGPSENLASRLLDRTSARCQRKTLLSAEYLLPVLSLSIYCMMSPDPSERTDCADVL